VGEVLADMPCEMIEGLIPSKLILTLKDQDVTRLEIVHQQAYRGIVGGRLWKTSPLTAIRKRTGSLRAFLPWSFSFSFSFWASASAATTTPSSTI